MFKSFSHFTVARNLMWFWAISEYIAHNLVHCNKVVSFHRLANSSITLVYCFLFLARQMDPWDSKLQVVKLLVKMCQEGDHAFRLAPHMYQGSLFFGAMALVVCPSLSYKPWWDSHIVTENILHLIFMACSITSVDMSTVARSNSGIQQYKGSSVYLTSRIYKYIYSHSLVIMQL